MWWLESAPLVLNLGVVGVGGERTSSLLGVRLGGPGLLSLYWVCCGWQTSGVEGDVGTGGDGLGIKDVSFVVNCVGRDVCGFFGGCDNGISLVRIEGRSDECVGGTGRAS